MTEPTTPLMQQYHAIKRQLSPRAASFPPRRFLRTFLRRRHRSPRANCKSLSPRAIAKKAKPIPMCGVPYHAAETYIARLIRAGYKIAICDQMEASRHRKKLVRREVVRVITPGTATGSPLLETRENNFLAAVARNGSGDPIGLAFVDLSTGEFRATEFAGAAAEDAPARRTPTPPPPRSPLAAAHNSVRRAPPLLNSTASAAVETRLDEWIFESSYSERILTRTIRRRRARRLRPLRPPASHFAPPEPCSTTCAKRPPSPPPIPATASPRCSFDPRAVASSISTASVTTSSRTRSSSTPSPFAISNSFRPVSATIAFRDASRRA